MTLSPRQQAGHPCRRDLCQLPTPHHYSAVASEVPSGASLGVSGLSGFQWVNGAGRCFAPLQHLYAEPDHLWGDAKVQREGVPLGMGARVRPSSRLSGDAFPVAIVHGEFEPKSPMPQPALAKSLGSLPRGTRTEVIERLA